VQHIPFLNSFNITICAQCMAHVTLTIHVESNEKKLCPNIYKHFLFKHPHPISKFHIHYGFNDGVKKP
jgi:hypothetical protein